MDIYTLLNKLRKARRKHTISAGAQGLFQELAAINNEERWSDVFCCRNAELESALNISEKTLVVYRNELIAAGLIVFKSGKSKRVPCDYSMNGSSIDRSIGSSIGSKIYGEPVSQSVSQLGEKTPDLLKEKSKTESKTRFEVAVEYLADIDANSNASFDPQQASLPDERKKVAQKKELPTIEVAMSSICDSAYWRNVVEHHKQSEADRQTLFKTFYEQREDHYLVKYPSKTEMAQHFYNWVPIHLSKDKLKQLNGNAISKATKLGNTTTLNRSTKDKRAELLSLNQQSSEFLRRIDH